MNVDRVPRQKSDRLHLRHMPGQTNLGKPTGTEEEPTAGPKNGYEYDAFEIGDFMGGWMANTGAELMPLGVAISKHFMPDEKFPIFRGDYGGTLRKRGVIFSTNVIADMASGPVQNMVRSLLHKSFPGIAGKPTAGSGFKAPEGNVLVSQLIKTVSTGLARTWLTNNVGAKPKPAPVPPPVANTPPGGFGAVKPPVANTAPAAPGAAAAPATPPAGDAGAGDAKKGFRFLGKDVKQIGADSLQFGVSTLISKVYDQTLGPVVQRTVNKAFGKDDVEVPKPKPITPGALAEGLAGAFLSGIVMRPVDAPTMSAPAAPAPTGGIGGAIAGMGGLGSILGQAAMNGLIASAFDTVYSRSLGPAIHDKVNNLAGIETRERKPSVPSGERMVRSFARSALAGGTYYLTDTLTQSFFANIGGQLGGPIGALMGMAGSAIFGMAAGTAVDTILGAQVGSAAGSLWSAVTGKPKAEDRPPEAPPEDEKPAATATAPLRRLPANVSVAQDLAAAAVKRAA